MTPESVAVVRAFFELGSAGDIAGASECLASEAVWLGTRGGLDEPRSARGPAAWMEFLQDYADSWHSFDFEAERLIDAGDAVVVLLRERAYARDGALEVENETAMIFKVRGGKIVEARGYLDRDEALREARLTDRRG